MDHAYAIVVPVTSSKEEDETLNSESTSVGGDVESKSTKRSRTSTEHSNVVVASSLLEGAPAPSISARDEERHVGFFFKAQRAKKAIT